MNMTLIRIINIVLVFLLVLLLRQLIWCLRCLWCHSRGKEMPEPIPFIPQQSGRVFQRHLPQENGSAEEEETL